MTLNNQFFQFCILVEDLETAMNHWIKTTKVGPFFVIPHCSVQGYRYRGTPGTLDFSGALAQAGPMQIELIQQHCDSPSAYRDTFPKGQEGFHHLCTFIDDYDAEVARYAALGAPVAHEGVFGDMRFAYVDTRPTLGFMTEIIEDRPSIRDAFKRVSDAAINWDGSDPIRML